jgi:hypothetical protein
MGRSEGESPNQLTFSASDFFFLIFHLEWSLRGLVWLSFSFADDQALLYISECTDHICVSGQSKIRFWDGWKYLAAEHLKGTKKVATSWDNASPYKATNYIQPGANAQVPGRSLCALMTNHLEYIYSNYLPQCRCANVLTYSNICTKKNSTWILRQNHLSYTVGFWTVIW